MSYIILFAGIVGARMYFGKKSFDQALIWSIKAVVIFVVVAMIGMRLQLW